MSLHISNSEAEKIALQLAAATGHTVEDEVLAALREREMRIKKNFDQSLYNDLKIISQQASKLPILDSRSPEDLLYDKNGLPK